MLIRLREWAAVRGQFSESEKAALTLAVTGETICPAGVTINQAKLSADLVAKLDRLLPSRRAKGAPAC